MTLAVPCARGDHRRGPGLPGTERAFDDANLARILMANSSPTDPRSVREAVADKHITRLVKSDDGASRFDAIESPDEVIKLAAGPGR